MAQSIGSIFKGKKAGSLGKVGCFSTHPLKNLNAVGDGGFFTTDSEDIFQIAKLYRNHGLETRDNCKFWGTVTRMDEIQACVLNYRLKNLNNLISIRQKNAETYYNLLNQNYVFIPKKRDYAVDTFHTFVIQVKKRDQLKKYLYDKGINSSIHYPQPIHLQDAAKYLGYKAGSFKNTERQSKEILSLPIHQNLDKSSIEYISHNINNFYKLYS